MCGVLKQPKLFQLYWGLQGLTGSLLEVLDLKMKRYPPIISPDNVAGGAVHNPRVQATPHANQKGPEVTLKVEGQRQEHTAISPCAQAATRASCCPITPATTAKTDGTRPSIANLMTTSGKESGTMKCKGMVNLVDFVPFLHHRSGTSSGSEDGGEHVEHQQESRDPLDFSDIVQDTQVAFCAVCVCV